MSLEAAARRTRLVARLGVAAREEPLELVGGGPGGVLVEAPHRGAGDEDALDGAVLEGAVGQGMRQRADEVCRVEAGAERQDAPGVVPGRSRQGLLQCGEEARRGIAKLCEGTAQLIEVRAAVGQAGPVAGKRRVLAGATRLELVARDAGQVRLVDPQLLLGHPHRQDLGDVLVGQGVAIAIPGEVALDVAQPVKHASGVVGVAG
jgi:hypothetical protein